MKDYALINRARGPYEEIFVLTFKAYGPNEVSISRMDKNLGKAWFPLSQLRPRQRPISSKNKAISVKDDCSTL